MALKMTGDSLTTISVKEIEVLWRDLLKAAEAVNSVENGAEKVAACMEVFGRNATNVLPMVQEIEDAMRKTVRT